MKMRELVLSILESTAEVKKNHKYRRKYKDHLHQKR